MTDAGTCFYGAMTSTRLFILGALARNGPMHGHQIRRLAHTDRTDLWTDIKPGSMYGALHRMATEGAIKEVSTERDGNLPTRVVYDLTPDGRDELIAYRDQALRSTKLKPDPVDLALQNAAELTEAELTAVVKDRRRALESQLKSWQHLSETAAPYLHDLEALTFRHSLARLEAEISWHEELLSALPAYFQARRPEIKPKPALVPHQ